MTRINLVPTEELSDQHLVAEWNEISHVPAALKRSLNAKKPNITIPEKFKLGAGHVMFFYNKGKYLQKRHEELRAECLRRGIKADPDRHAIREEQFPPEYWNDWDPTDQDLLVIRQRIQERINQKPEWYRWTK
mgnify:FL=1|tara:strand:+ start:4398 stop:4796 length:399 start_codon:yes stop_codon:yes gene_type:complete